MDPKMTKEQNAYAVYREWVELAKKATKAYYDEDAPIMEDPEFDELMRKIKEYEALYGKADADSPTQMVGGSSGKSSFEKVRHKVPMLSLQDVFSMDDVESFLSRLPAKTCCSVEEKIDGLSLSVTFKNGLLVRAETRGDSLVGEDVTENARFIQGIPKRLNPILGAENLDEVEVRCEVYLPVDRFLELNKEKEEKGEKLFANPRNAAAGLLRTKELSTVKSAGLCAFAFNLQRYTTLDGNPFDAFESSHCMSLSTLSEMDFKTVAFTACHSTADVEKSIKNIGERRNSLPYWIDGAVVKVDSLELRKKLSETAKYPLWAVAYKYQPEEKETVIRDIVLQTGRTGRVTPVAIFDPVYLAGTKVEKATLHNPEIIAKLGINVGDTVLVRKAAEIIPEIVKVVKPAYFDEGVVEPKGVYDIFAHTCPSCGGMIVPGTDENGDSQSGAYCKNPNCPAQIARKFEFFASRDVMDIRGFGPAVIDKFIENGWLKSVVDIYKLKDHRDEIASLEGFGVKGTDKLLAAIEKSKENDIDRLIKALGIPGVGRHIGKALAKRYDSIFKIRDISLETLADIDGIGEISAKAIYDYFRDKDNYATLVRLHELGVNTFSKSYVEKQSSTDGKLSGLTFVITGTLPSWSRAEAAELIEKNGGKVSSSVSKKTDYLLMGESAGSKLEKAKTLGVNIITEGELSAVLFGL